MNRLFLFGILLIVPVIGNSQNFILPTLYLDSLLFETTKFRTCDSVSRYQADEIAKLGRELVETNKALTLSQSSNSTLSALLNNAKNGQEILSMQFQKDLKEEKKRTRKWKGIALIGAFVIIIQAVAPN